MCIHIYVTAIKAKEALSLKMSKWGTCDDLEKGSGKWCDYIIPQKYL